MNKSEHTATELSKVAEAIFQLLLDKHLSYAEMAMVIGLAYAILIGTQIKESNE